MSTEPTNTNLKKIVIPIGFNALVDDEKKTALIIGEYKSPSQARTSLTLVTRITIAELLAAIPAGYQTIYPPKAPAKA
jgi:hypothetical protein